MIKPLVGGGFGGKSEVIPLEIIAAIAARKVKSVKITYTREEVFWAHRGRPRTLSISRLEFRMMVASPL